MFLSFTVSSIPASLESRSLSAEAITSSSSIDAQVLKIGGVDIGDKLDGIEAGAQVNKIETIKCNSTTLTITNKTVNIPAATDAAYGVVQFMTSAEAQSMWAAAWASASAT